MGYRAGGNSSGSTQGCCSSSLTHDSWLIPCMQERIIGVTPLCWGTSILPMYGTHGMWATSGPFCSAKETPVWGSPASSRSAHSPLRAQPEGLCALCVGSFSSRHKKGLFPHTQVLLYWVCPSDAAVPVELGLSSSLAKALVQLESCPEVPSSSFLPETFLLLTTWFQLLWRSYAMQVSHAWQIKEGHPKPRRERHT